MNNVEYFKSQKHIKYGVSKRDCKTCKKYPTEIYMVENPNYSLIDFIFKGERMYNWYCGNCLPSVLTPNK